MKLLSSLSEIPELQSDNVHIRDKEEFLQKINKMIKDGHNKLQIVTDFDHTLTRHHLDNGNIVLTSFGKFCASLIIIYITGIVNYIIFMYSLDLHYFNLKYLFNVLQIVLFSHINCI